MPKIKKKKNKNKSSQNAKHHKKNKGTQNQQTQLLPRLSSSSAQKSEYKHEITVFNECFGINDSTRSTPPTRQMIADLQATKINTLANGAKDDDVAAGELANFLEKNTEAYIDVAMLTEDESYLLHYINSISTSIKNLLGQHGSNQQEQMGTRKSIPNYQAALVILNYNLYSTCSDKKEYLMASLEALTTFCSNEISFSMLDPKHRIAIVYCISMIFATVEKKQIRGEIREDNSTVKNTITALFCNQKNFTYLYPAIQNHLKYRETLEAIFGLARFYIQFPNEIIDMQENGYQQKEVHAILNVKQCCLLFKDIFTGLLEQKQIIWLDHEMYTSYTVDTATYGLLGIYQLIETLVFIHKEYCLDRNGIRSMVTHLNSDQLLSDIKALYQFLQYLYQSKQINVRDLFVGTPLSILSQKAKRCIIKANLDYINAMIIETEIIQIDCNNGLEKYIESLEKAEEEKLETTEASKKTCNILLKERTTPSSQDNIVVDDADSKSSSEEIKIEDDTTTPAFQVAYSYFKYGDFDSARKKIAKINPKKPEEQLERITFTLDCEFKLFGIRRNFIVSVIKKIERQADYVQKHKEELVTNPKVRREQRRMYSAIIQALNLLRNNVIAFGPAIEINQRVFERLTQCQQEVLFQISDSSSSTDFSLGIQSACQRLHEWNLDIMDIIDNIGDAEKKAAFETWSIFWSETMVKGILGPDAEEDLVAIYVKSLQEKWRQYIEICALLRKFSQQITYFSQLKDNIIQMLRKAKLIKEYGQLQPSEEQQLVIQALRWAKGKSKQIAKSQQKISEGIFKNKGPTIVKARQKLLLVQPNGSRPSQRVKRTPADALLTKPAARKHTNVAVPQHAQPQHDLPVTNLPPPSKPVTLADNHLQGSQLAHAQPDSSRSTLLQQAVPRPLSQLTDIQTAPVAYNTASSVAAAKWPIAGTGMLKSAPSTTPQLVGHILVPSYTLDAPYGFQRPTLFQPLSQAQAPFTTQQAPVSSAIGHAPAFFRPLHPPPEDIQAKIKGRVGEVIAFLNSSCEREAQTELKALVESKDFHTLGGSREQGDINLHELLLNANAILQGHVKEGSVLDELMKTHSSQVQSLAISAPAIL